MLSHHKKHHLVSITAEIINHMILFIGVAAGQADRRPAGPIIEGGGIFFSLKRKKKARAKHEVAAASSSSSEKSQEVEARVRNIEE